VKTLSITINYKSSAFTLRAVQSVLDSESLGPVQVVVVDNSEDEEEQERLRDSLPPGVILRVSPENIGFGRACNLAFERFEADQILLLNPDARLLPDCLRRLQQMLSGSNRVAAVSPQIFWDEELQFYLPRSIPPALFEVQEVTGLLGLQSPINRVLSGVWRYSCVKMWQSKKPVRVANLSGGHVLLKREAVMRAGGLFDPRFFLYFEDTDLFIRLRKAGYRLMVEPGAQAVHYVDQCGPQDRERKQSLMARSRAKLFEKHATGFSRHKEKIAHRLRYVSKNRMPQIPRPELAAPFVLNVPQRLQKRWLFEVSPNPTFIPSAGRFGKGMTMNFPEKQWAMLAPGQYYGRLGSPKGFGGRFSTVSWIVNGHIS